MSQFPPPPAPPPPLQGNWAAKADSCWMAQRFKQLLVKHDEGWQFVNEGTEQVSAAPDASLQEIAFIQSTHDACSVWGLRLLPRCFHLANPCSCCRSPSGGGSARSQARPWKLSSTPNW